MTLTSDKIELAQQIADVLEERINALSHVFFGSTYTKSDCCKHLIKPLPREYQIDTFLESLPTHAAKSPRERYSRLMSCFDQNGELLCVLEIKCAETFGGFGGFSAVCMTAIVKEGGLS